MKKIYKPPFLFFLYFCIGTRDLNDKIVGELSRTPSRVKEELWEEEMLRVGGASAEGCQPDAGSFPGKTEQSEDESDCGGGGRSHTSVCSKPPYENECTTLLLGPHLDQRQDCAWAGGLCVGAWSNGGAMVQGRRWKLCMK